MNGIPLELEEVKKLQLGILSDVAGFCERNGLRYYLAYGTLLGAVRHKGYIPWDDDIDIMMPRPDYMKFMETYGGKDSRYRGAFMQKTPEFWHVYGKAYDTATIVHTPRSFPGGWGVSIDIFPLDGIPKHFLSVRLPIIRTLKRVICIRQRCIVNDKNLLVKTMSRMIMNLPFGIIRLAQKIVDRMLRALSYDKAWKVGLLCMLNRSRTGIFDKAMLEGSVPMEFEGRLYSVPKRYDEVLKNLYGDYMTLPPESERVRKHNALPAFYRDAD